MSTIPDYKGHEIQVSSDGLFQALKGGEVVVSSQNLVDLKKQIDLLTKLKERIPVFVRSPYWGSSREHFPEWVEGTITSIREARSGYGRRYEFRVTFTEDKRKSWHDYQASDIFKKTPENAAKVKEITDLWSETQRLEKKAETISKAMEHYTDKELVGE